MVPIRDTTPETLLKEVRHNIDAVIKQETLLGKALWSEFLNLHPADSAQFFETLDQETFKQLFMKLPKEKLCTIFGVFSESMQTTVLSFLEDKGRSAVLSCLNLDEMTDLFEKLSDQDLQRYLELLDKEDRERVLSLLKFDSETAGGIMDTEVLSLQDDYTVKESIELIQHLEVKKDLHRQIFITNKKKQLVGSIMLEDLVLHKPFELINTFMRENKLVAQAHEDSESIAQKMMHYNLMIMPVVSGGGGYFLGVISDFALIDVIEKEASEDVYRMSAMQPVTGTYFDLPFSSLLYQRGYILIILLLAQSISSTIILHHEQLLTGFLFAFIGMLTSTGGNVGSQTSVVIIQGMASGEINHSNMRRFFKREIALAFAMSFLLGVVAFFRAYYTTGKLVESIAISSSLACIVVVSVTIGSVIPVVLKRLNVDPAYSAGPFLATIMDILGILIFCAVSKLFIFS